MTPEKRNPTSPLEIGREEEERLIAIWKLLKDFDECYLEASQGL